MKNSKMAWRNIKCDKCGEYLTSPMDLVLYNSEIINNIRVITEITFRHGCGRGCDSKYFVSSRHVMNGYEDILEGWATSPFNTENA